MSAPASHSQPKISVDVDPREYCKMRYSAPPECCKCGNCQLVPPDRLVAWSDQFEALSARIEELEDALRPFAGTKRPELRRTLIDFDRYGLRRSISPMELAMVKAARALEAKP